MARIAQINNMLISRNGLESMQFLDTYVGTFDMTEVVLSLHQSMCLLLLRTALEILVSETYPRRTTYYQILVVKATLTSYISH